MTGNASECANWLHQFPWSIPWFVSRVRVLSSCRNVDLARTSFKANSWLTCLTLPLAIRHRSYAHRCSSLFPLRIWITFKEVSALIPYCILCRKHENTCVIFSSHSTLLNKFLKKVIVPYWKSKYHSRLLHF